LLNFYEQLMASFFSNLKLKNTANKNLIHKFLSKMKTMCI
jgi:hypothetical protein